MVFACLIQAAYANPTGMLVGRTGDILHVSLAEPVSEGSIVTVTLPDNGEADARVLSCTKEWPYIALAKSGQVGRQVTPAYSTQAIVPQIVVNNVVKPAKSKADDRFSLQAGAFYPVYGQIGSGTYLDYWQSYRANYTILKLGAIDATVSGEYMKGFASFNVGDKKMARSAQVIPVTLMGRVKPFRVGSWQMFVGAGAGFYGMHNQDTVDGVTTETHGGALGHELTAGLEARGWMIEARYRNVPNTEIRGYSLALGTRF